MKKRIIYIVCILLVLVACAPNEKKDEVVKEDEAKKQTPSIVPSYKLSKDNYKTILPFRPSKARGVITNQVANRLDIVEVEEWLIRHSKEVFDTEDYYFEVGHDLTESMRSEEH